MAAPSGGPPEWLIWNEEFKRQIKAINQRLDISPQPSDLESLSNKMDNIIASYSELQTEKDALQDLVIRLEQESNNQDQINAVKSQDQEQLRTRFKTQENEFGNVIQAVDRMQRTNQIEKEQYQRDMKDLRDLVNGVIGGGKHGDDVHTRRRESRSLLDENAHDAYDR